MKPLAPVNSFSLLLPHLKLCVLTSHLSLRSLPSKTNIQDPAETLPPTWGTFPGVTSVFPLIFLSYPQERRKPFQPD